MRMLGRTIWHEIINFVALSKGRLWTPADEISNIGWWDASDEDTITVISSEVRTLDDKSGNAPDLTAFASFGPATGTHTLNSLNMLYYDGTEAMATYNADFAVPTSGNFTVFQLAEVFLPLDNTACGMFSMLDAGGVDWQFVGGLSTANWNGRIVASELGGVNTNFSAMGIGPSVYCVEFDFDSGTITGYVSGNAVGGTTYTIKVTDPQTFIVMSNRVGNALAGHYGETVIVEDVSEGTRQIMEGYLTWKWGIESQLPIGHPYKDAAPLANSGFGAGFGGGFG